MFYITYYLYIFYIDSFWIFYLFYKYKPLQFINLLRPRELRNSGPICVINNMC